MGGRWSTVRCLCGIVHHHDQRYDAEHIISIVAHDIFPTTKPTAAPILYTMKHDLPRGGGVTKRPPLYRYPFLLRKAPVFSTCLACVISCTQELVTVVQPEAGKARLAISYPLSPTKNPKRFLYVPIAFCQPLHHHDHDTRIASRPAVVVCLLLFVLGHNFSTQAGCVA